MILSESLLVIYHIHLLYQQMIHRFLDHLAVIHWPLQAAVLLYCHHDRWMC